MATTLPNPQSPTHDAPRITKARFTQLLKSKDSPMVPEASAVYDVLISEGVEPAFALAQFRVESQYGTAGHAKVTGSIGNMLYDSNLTILASGQYAPGNGYTYAKYNNYVDAAKDYCRYLHWYRDRYGLDTIYEATARWLGKTPGSSGHTSYVNIIIADMVEYQYPNGAFYEAGDKMIYTAGNFDRTTGRLRTKYPVVNGVTKLYRGTNGDFLKTFSATGDKGDVSYAWYMGDVQGSPKWGAVLIGTSLADPKGTWVFIQNIDTSKIKYV